MPSVRVRLLPLLVALATLLPVPAAAHAAPAWRGVQLHSLWSSSPLENIDRELELARAMHANTVRVDVAWSSLETEGPGLLSPWYVQRLDRMVDGALARGMRVVAVLHSTPCWASSAPETIKLGCTGAYWDRGVTKHLPGDPADFGRIARWVTTRYGGGLAALELWNEPNHPNFLTAGDPAAAYAKLVTTAYPMAKQGDPDVPVLAGVTAFADRPFLERLYALGLKGNNDGLAVHPYNEWRAPADEWQAEYRKYTLLPGLRWIHELQLANGDDKGLWLTEFGWTNCTLGADKWCVTTEQQADFLERTFPLLDLEPYVKAALVYNLRDKGTDIGYTEDNFGLLKRDYTPKPAYAAVQRAFARYLGPADQSAVSAGAFTASGAAARRRAAADAAAEANAARGTLKVRLRRVRGRVVVSGRGAPSTAGVVRVGARRMPVRTSRKGGFVKDVGRPPRGRRIVVVLGGRSAAVVVRA